MGSPAVVAVEHDATTDPAAIEQPLTLVQRQVDDVTVAPMQTPARSDEEGVETERAPICSLT
jgi:hypothetical protein